MIKMESIRIVDHEKIKRRLIDFHRADPKYRWFEDPKRKRDKNGKIKRRVT